MTVGSVTSLFFSWILTGRRNPVENRYDNDKEIVPNEKPAVIRYSYHRREILFIPTG